MISDLRAKAFIRKIVISILYATSAMSCIQSNSHAQGLGSIFDLPSLDLSKQLEKYPNIPAKDSTDPAFQPKSIIKLPDTTKTLDGAISEHSGSSPQVPFVAPNSVVIQFAPNTTSADVDSYLAAHNFKVVKTFPTIGAVQVKTDLSTFFQPKITDTSPNDAILRGISSTILEFKKDDRIQSVSPDIFLSDKSTLDRPTAVTNMPSSVGILQLSGSTSEITDWGISDIEADKLWELPGANDGVVFGVIDAGFARHDDLTFLEFPEDTKRDDHGNHVAGISCARHNGIGVRGVIPNCFIRARAGDVYFQSAEGKGAQVFFVLFSQILGSMDDFVRNQDDVSVYNVSLGYNWKSNFGIDIDAADSAIWRTIVEEQGGMLISVLLAADKRNKVIFSAAGNDSDGIPQPAGSKFASPFNFAALVAKQKGIAENGVIVEAHNSTGIRATFSNTGADLSCPGVDIESTVAFDDNRSPSNSVYGKMSGTSMASPYCAAALVLFKLVRHGYTNLEALHCLVASGQKSDDGVPMVRLQAALLACPLRSAVSTIPR